MYVYKGIRLEPECHVDNVCNTIPVKAATLVSSKVMAVLYHFTASLVLPSSTIW